MMWRSEKYRRFVAEKPCLSCGTYGCQAHHCRDLVYTGVGMKPGDQWVIPLCPDCHRLEHDHHDILSKKVKLNAIADQLNEYMVGVK